MNLGLKAREREAGPDLEEPIAHSRSGSVAAGVEDRVVEAERLSLRTRREGGLLTVEVYGEVDLANANLLEQEVCRAEAAGPAQIVVDLRGTEFIDSTGLQVLFLAGMRADENSHRLAVHRRSTGQVAGLLSATRIDRSLDVL